VADNARAIALAEPIAATAPFQRLLGRFEFRWTWSMTKKPTVLQP
jgi:hypothetical protein